MKLFFDFLPVLLFFATFKWATANKAWAAEFATAHFGALVSGGIVAAAEAPVLLATLVAMAATLLQVGWLTLRGRKVGLMLWVSFALVTTLGALTVWFHNETFIKFKPSGLYWAMGLTLWISRSFFGKNVLKSLMGEQIQLPPQIWQRLNLMWIAFFAFMGMLNLYVAYSYSTEVWVNFKAFWSLGLMFAFAIGQAVYMNRWLQNPTTPSEQSSAP